MSKDTSSTEAAAEEEAPSARVGPAVLLKEAPSENPLFHDLYPARRGKSISFSTWQVMMGFAKNNAYVQRCEDNVIMNLEKMPMVQTMIGALESMGCAVELDRHISCEVCTVGAYMGTNRGGYDDSNNQLFICANNCTETGDVHGNRISKI
jgi:inner membrane protease ATP23